jgi:hypothetical protein
VRCRKNENEPAGDEGNGRVYSRDECCQIRRPNARHEFDATRRHNKSAGATRGTDRMVSANSGGVAPKHRSV